MDKQTYLSNKNFALQLTFNEYPKEEKEKNTIDWSTFLGGINKEKE